MKLKSLSIEKAWYGPNKGQYQGKIAFEGEHGEVQVTLNPADCAKLFGVVAEGVVGTAREVAERLTAECMAGSPPALKIG